MKITIKGNTINVINIYYWCKKKRTMITLKKIIRNIEKNLTRNILKDTVRITSI